jgi:signal peptidase I
VKIPECKKALAPDQILWDMAIELLHNRRMVKFQAPGVSMSPFIRHNEMITVKPCSHGDLTFGDIILYHGFGNQSRQLSIPLEDKKIVHRFLRRRDVDGESRLITKGDNNYLCDPPVSPQQVLGKVVEIEKNGWRLRLDTPLGRLLNTLCGLAIMPPVSFFSFPCMKKMKRLFTFIENQWNLSNDRAKKIGDKNHEDRTKDPHEIPRYSPSNY